MQTFYPLILFASAAQLVRFLEVGLIMNMEQFPAFRVAFEPGIVKWDVDPEPFIQRASGIFTGGGMFCTNLATNSCWCAEKMSARVLLCFSFYEEARKRANKPPETVGISLECKDVWASSCEHFALLLGIMSLSHAYTFLRIGRGSRICWSHLYVSCNIALT